MTRAYKIEIEKRDDGHCIAIYCAESGRLIGIPVRGLPSKAAAMKLVDVVRFSVSYGVHFALTVMAQVRIEETP